MTGLLVSVRSAAEAEIAWAAGADIIDVKEPSRGSLGAADPNTWRQILETIGDRAVTSAVLGELSEEAAEHLATQTAGFKFAKIGPAGCHSRSAWQNRWKRLVHLLPRGVQLIPVAYADWQRAQAPSPRDILPTTATHSRLLVLDTFDKSAGSLLDILPWTEIETIFDQAQTHDVRLVLAGGLQEAAIKRLLALQPAFIGVRGAACLDGRAGSIDFNRVARLSALVRATAKLTSFARVARP